MTVAFVTLLLAHGGNLLPTPVDNPVVGVLSIEFERSNMVSGAARMSKGIDTIWKTARSSNWRLKPALFWEVTPPMRGGPQRVAT